jgi:hypothetical protein
MRDEAGKLTKAFRHICWDGCMFSNETMMKQQTWNDILAAMVAVRDAHGWNETQRIEAKPAEQPRQASVRTLAKPAAKKPAKKPARKAPGPKALAKGGKKAAKQPARKAASLKSVRKPKRPVKKAVAVKVAKGKTSKTPPRKPARKGAKPKARR